jgi:hypothetical protein
LNSSLGGLAKLKDREFKSVTEKTRSTFHVVYVCEQLDRLAADNGISGFLERREQYSCAADRPGRKSASTNDFVIFFSLSVT